MQRNQLKLSPEQELEVNKLLDKYKEYNQKILHKFYIDNLIFVVSDIGYSYILYIITNDCNNEKELSINAVIFTSSLTQLHNDFLSHRNAKELSAESKLIIMLEILGCVDGFFNQ